ARERALRQEIENGDDEPRGVRGDGGVAENRACLHSLLRLLIRQRDGGVGLRLVKNPDLHGHCPRALSETPCPAGPGHPETADSGYQSTYRFMTAPAGHARNPDRTSRGPEPRLAAPYPRSLHRRAISSSPNGSGDFTRRLSIHSRAKSRCR